MFEAIRVPDRRGPLNLNPVGVFSRPQAQHIARIAGGKIASAAAFENAVLDTIGRPSDPGANRKTDEVQPDPMICVANDIMKDQGSLATDADDNIHTPVVIEIAHGKSPGGIQLFEGWTTRGTDVIKPSTIVVKEQQGFPILQAVGDRFDQIVRMPIDQKQIWPAIQIEIDQARAPA